MGAVRSVRGAVEEHKQTLQEAMVHDKMVREYSIRLYYLIRHCSVLGRVLYIFCHLKGIVPSALGFSAAYDTAVQAPSH